MKNFTKVIKVLINTLMTIIIVLGVIFLLLYALKIKPYIVQSGSMEPNIHVGSICFINEKVAYEDIKVNDIIAFQSNGIKATHRAIAITEDGIETKGDANESSDGISTTKENYIGKNIFSIPKLGFVVNNIQNPIILVTVIAVFAILIIVEALLSKVSKTEDKRKE